MERAKWGLARSDYDRQRIRRIAQKIKDGVYGPDGVEIIGDYMYWYDGDEQIEVDLGPGGGAELNTYYQYTTSASTLNDWVSTGQTYTMTLNHPPVKPAAPKPQTALDWLAEQIEATCKLARA